MNRAAIILGIALATLATAGATHAQGRYTAPRPAPAASVPVSDAQRCADLWREYERSGICYARYRTVFHGVKAEAFERCGPPLKDPSRECPRQ